MEWLQLSFAGLLKIAPKLMFWHIFAKFNEGVPGKKPSDKLFCLWFCRKLKEDKEEIEEQRRLRQEEEERSLVTVS